MEKYQKVVRNLNLDDFGDDYQLKGTYSYEEKTYQVGIIRNLEKIKLTFGDDEASLAYYVDNQNNFIKLSNFQDEYISLNTKNAILDYQNLSKQFSNYITKDDYIKKFYLDGVNPIVETNLVLSQEQVKNILGLSGQKKQYEVTFIFKNHAFTSEALSMKMIINNLNNNKRYVILYQDEALTISDDQALNLKFTLENKNQDFTLKIYKNDNIYSVLSGVKQEDDYLYKYQIINQIYNISLTVSKAIDHYSYHLLFNIENEEGVVVQKEAELSLLQLENIILDEKNENGIDYTSLTEEEQSNYQQNLEAIIMPLKQLVDGYQVNID